MADEQTEIPGRTVVVVLPAEIDMINANENGERLSAALAPGVTTVIADMTATTFCDTSGIRMLVLAHQQAAARDAELRVVLSSDSVLRAFALTKVDGLLLIHGSLDDAMAPPTVPGPPAAGT